MLPIGTSIKPRRTPYANYILIIINIIVFALTMKFTADPATGNSYFMLRDWAQILVLRPEPHPYLWQFVSYAFLHGGTGPINHALMHILGNMFFLFLFGNNVNDKLGNIGYTIFYLAGAVFSGVGYAMMSTNPVLGASGAVAAITGAYLVLFPNTTITVIIWFFYDIDVRALFFIVFKLIFIDNVLFADPSHGIAYNAHLAGYGFGILASLGLLATGLIKPDYNDLWSMIRQWNRRRKFKDAVSDGYDPYKGQAARKPIDSAVSNTTDDAVLELRGRISQAMNSRNPAQAAELFLELMKVDNTQILPRQLQLDVANQLMSEGKWEASAAAYQSFLSRYAEYQFAEQVHLMLGILYSRYLNRHEDALEHLQTAQERLRDPGQKQMCQREIEKLRSS